MPVLHDGHVTRLIDLNQSVMGELYAVSVRTTEVYTWTGEWDDAEGNVVHYNLTGYHQRREDLRGEIRSYAAYVPAKVVSEGPKGGN